MAYFNVDPVLADYSEGLGNALANPEPISAVPASQPGVMSRLGRYLGSNEGKNLMNMGMNTANIVGQQKNFGPTLAKYMGSINSMPGVAQQTGGTVPPAGANPNTLMNAIRGPQAPTPQTTTQAAPIAATQDTNKDGKIDEKDIVITQKIPVGAALKSKSFGGEGYLDLSKGLANFPNSSGANVGSPESVNAPTTSKMSDQQALELIASGLGPEVAIDLAKGRMANVPIRTKAEADMLEATVKQRLLGPTYNKLVAEAEDLAFKRDPIRLGAIAKAEQEAKTLAEMKGKEDSDERRLVAYGETPQGQRVIDPAITSALKIRPNSTYYDYARENGMANVHTLYERYVSNLNARLAAGSAVSAAEKTALGPVLSSNTARIGQLITLKDPATLSTKQIEQGKQLEAIGKKTFLTEADKAELGYLRKVNESITKVLMNKGGASVDGSIQAPTPTASAPISSVEDAKKGLSAQFPGKKITDVSVSGDKVFFSVDGQPKQGTLGKKPAASSPTSKVESKVNTSLVRPERPKGVSPRDWAKMTPEQKASFAEDRRNKYRGTSAKVI
jgi:hypothetical protein